MFPSRLQLPNATLHRAAGNARSLTSWRRRMGSRTSNKPIVFVFGAKKGDADGRKKNLSAINTQVAYRAHERRREKNLKTRQRAQAKELEDANLDQPTSALAAASGTDNSPTSSTKVELDTNHTRFSPQQVLQHDTQYESQPSVRKTSQESVASIAAATSSSQLQPSRTKTNVRLLATRRESDLASDVSSDRDTVNNDMWSTSPSSARHSTPSTDLGSSSPTAPVSIQGHFRSALDPFFKLPGIASDREKWLVHFCTFVLLVSPIHANALRFPRNGSHRVRDTYQFPFLS